MLPFSLIGDALEKNLLAEDEGARVNLDKPEVLPIVVIRRVLEREIDVKVEDRRSNALR